MDSLLPGIIVHYLNNNFAQLVENAPGPVVDHDALHGVLAEIGEQYLWHN